MKKAALILVLFFQACAFTFAGSGAVRGYIADKASNSLLAGANIIIDKINSGCAADSNGYYFIAGIPAGTYNLTASMIGYYSQMKTITITANETAVINFSLEPNALSLSEVVVQGDRSFTASSSLAFNKFDFELRPRQSSQDLLKLVPGLFIAQHAGGGKAEQIFLRGFDADHGTDINISVDGLPVNMVSHAHGQGYSDLHFVIPETIKELDVQKGPYFVQNGDFSTAGSVKFKTLDNLNVNVFSLEGGNFGSFRTLLMSSIPIGNPNISAYTAGEYYKTNGYFDSRSDFNRYNIFGKIINRIDEDKTLSFTTSNYGAKWNASGQIPQRAINERLIDRFGSIDNSEGGTTGRTNFNLSYSSLDKDESEFQLNMFLTRYRFQLFSDFTFFLYDPVNGDEIEQDDDRITLGVNSSYTISNKIFGSDSRTSFGMELRNDDARVELWHTAKRIRLNEKVNALVKESEAGLYAGEEITLNSRLRFNFGLRGDLFYFNVKDRMIDSTGQNLSGDVQKFIISPKFNVVYSPVKNLDLFYNFGSSFHSNDARVVVTHPDQRTLPRATGMEIGSKFKISANSLLSLTLWAMDLQNEFVYNGDEGTFDVEGATRRIGLDAGLREQITAWLWADLDLNLCRGRFKYYPSGANYIPLAPGRTSTGGLTARFSVGIEGSIRFRSMDGKPANEENTVHAIGYTIFEFYVSYQLSSYKLSLSVDNLFNVNWDEAQFDTESRLRNEAVPVSEIHFTPGTPRSIKTAISYAF